MPVPSVQHAQAFELPERGVQRPRWPWPVEPEELVDVVGRRSPLASENHAVEGVEKQPAAGHREEATQEQTQDEERARGERHGGASLG